MSDQKLIDDAITALDRLNDCEALPMPLAGAVMSFRRLLCDFRCEELGLADPLDQYVDQK